MLKIITEGLYRNLESRKSRSEMKLNCCQEQEVVLLEKIVHFYDDFLKDLADGREEGDERTACGFQHCSAIRG